MLAAKAGQYNKALSNHLPEAKQIQEALRRQLPNNIFLQFLAGSKAVRNGGLGYILKVIAWTTLVIGPLLLLLLLQVQFLPFHDKYITWIHRLALILDLALLWVLWPAVLTGTDKIQWPRPTLAKKAALASALLVGFSCLVVTFPGEWQNNTLIFKSSGYWTSQRRTTFFSNILILPGFNIYEALKVDDPKKVAWHEHLIDLSGRDLNGAVLTNANLTKAYLINAHLRGAVLDAAQLPGAKLYNAELQDAHLETAQLQGASLVGANLQGAYLAGAQFQGASLTSANLQVNSLNGAQFQGALLNGANLQNMSFPNVNLEGASLNGANLKGASFILTSVWMADVRGAIGKDVHVVGVLTDPCTKKDSGNACTFEEIRQIIVQQVPQGSSQDVALAQIESQLGPEKTQKEATDGELTKAWAKFAAGG